MIEYQIGGCQNKNQINKKRGRLKVQSGNNTYIQFITNQLI